MGELLTSLPSTLGWGRDMEKYLLDSNVFIQAHRQYYAFDIAPKYWTELSKYSISSVLNSIENVKDELTKGNDDLAKWIIQNSFVSFHQVSDISTQREYGGLMQWAMKGNHFTTPAITEFAKVADGWLVAYAKANGYTVVTHESSDPNCKKRVKIPDACKHAGVKCINIFELLRKLNIVFC